MNYQVKIGDTICVEEAWEDERGAYHDEYAKVLGIDDRGEMQLDFFEASDEVKKFLESSDGYYAKYYQPIAKDV